LHFLVIVFASNRLEEGGISLFNALFLVILSYLMME